LSELAWISLASVTSLSWTVLLETGTTFASDRTRLIDLTRESLPIGDDNMSNENDDTRFQEMTVLEQVDDSMQAVGLPLIVASSLVASLFFFLLQSTNFSSNTTMNGGPFL
jgi:hypothetical protein